MLPFLQRTEILVCLLPATPATKGILNLAQFSRLRRDGALGGAYLINAGRGSLQVDADIIAALDQGLLAGATLDVFPTEPLPVSSPLWVHPKVTITPHNAAASMPHAIVANVLRQIDRHEIGMPLENVIDRAAGLLEPPQRCVTLAAGGADARDRLLDRLDRHRHVKRIGVNERRGVAHDGDVAFPEHQVAAPRAGEIGRERQRRAERSFLHVAVAWAGDAAGRWRQPAPAPEQSRPRLVLPPQR